MLKGFPPKTLADDFVADENDDGFGRMPYSRKRGRKAFGPNSIEYFGEANCQRRKTLGRLRLSEHRRTAFSETVQTQTEKLHNYDN